MLPELHACQEAEDFFEALRVAFEPEELAAHRLAVLRRFGELLVEIVDGHPGADDAALRSMARAALQEAYAAARSGVPFAPGSRGGCGGCAVAAACGPAQARGAESPAGQRPGVESYRG